MQSNGTVRYHFKLKNGVVPVPPESSLLFKTSSDDVVLTNSTCTYGDIKVPTSTDPYDTSHPITNTSQLSEGAEFTCTVDVVVDTTHAALGKVPAVSILARYIGNNITRAFYIETKNTTEEVAVYTGANLSSADTEVLATNGTFFSGMCGGVNG